MKTKYFFLGFYSLLIFAIISRMVQIIDYTNKRTGFFIKSSSTFFSLIILFLLLFFSSLSFTVKRCPLKFPKVRSVTSFTSLLVGLSLLLRVFSIYQKTGFDLTSPQYLIEGLFTIAACLFFFAYTAKRFFHFHIKRIFYVVPLVYWLFMLILSYLRISRMALIAENTLMILATCFTAMFFLYFAKIANGIKTQASKQKILLFFGSLSVLLCETFAFPQIFYNLSEKPAVVHNDISFMFIYLATGIFVASFLGTFFSERNLLKRKHHISGSERILPTDINDVKNET